MNKLVAELVKLNGIDHRTTSAYNPRANGAVERTNGVIEVMLKKELAGKMADWPAYLPFVQLAYNAKVSATTGSTPFSLMLGRTLNDFDIYKRMPKKKNVDLAVWKVRQEELTRTIYPTIGDRVRKEKEKAVDSFLAKSKIIGDDYFPAGALVMMRDVTRESKWDPVYEGTFTVVRRNRGGAYLLRDKAQELLKRTVPADQLKLVTRHADQPSFENPSLKVHEILDDRVTDENGVEYLVKWKSKDVEDSWEPVENFDDIAVFKKYWRWKN